MAEQGRFHGKVAVVTGAGDGMGAAITRRFLEEGACVLAADIAAQKLKVTHGDETPKLRLVAQDVTEADAAERLIGAAAEAFGGLDILVNAAGVVHFEPVDSLSRESWQHTFAVNADATFKLCQRAIPALRARGGGRIVNFASIAAVRAGVGLASYVASKHAVAGLTKSLAVELGADGITANYIMPGFILTGMTRPLVEAAQGVTTNFVNMGVVGRMGQPDDVASAVLFIASDEASFITGHGLAVDGGYLAKH